MCAPKNLSFITLERKVVLLVSCLFVVLCFGHINKGELLEIIGKI